jgi:FkbM family methyltransferase
MEKNHLIYDIGMHMAQDTAYYLGYGYRVVAVDAFPEMIERAREQFPVPVQKGDLTLLNFAMAGADNETVEFYISEKSEWNSINKNISTRQNQKAASIKVPTAKLSTIMRQYGVPYYCKIDVEGFDAVCIQSLNELPAIPKFISCETECFSENQQVSEEDILDTLNSLHAVGYTKFKLIEQDNLSPLYPGVSFYQNTRNEPFFIRVLRKLVQQSGYKIEKISNREKLSWKHQYNFPFGATGPFGNDLEGSWLDYATAKETLLFHRSEFFSRKVDYPLYTIWCDWHATY